MSSSSKSSTSSTQNYTSTTQDNRIVAAEGALTFSQSDGNSIYSSDDDVTNYSSIDNSVNTVNSLDAGAIGKAFDFAEAVSKGAADSSVASVGAMYGFGVDALGAVKDAYANSAAASAASAAAAASASAAATAATQRAYGDAMGNVNEIAKTAMTGTSTAWGKAFDGLDGNMKMSLAAITSTNQAANDQIRNSNKDVSDAYKGVTDTLADAWKSSKAGEQKMLAFGLLAVVGISAAKILGR